MRAVAHGLLGDGFAPTKINLTGLFSRKVHSVKTTTFLPLVAEWPEQMEVSSCL